MRFPMLPIVVCLGIVAIGGPDMAVQRALANAQGTQPLRPWSAPRTPDGHPDLEGVWANNTVTPFERPRELAGRALLTEGEVAVLKERATRLFDGSGDTAPGDELFLALLTNPDRHITARSTGDYNLSWQLEDFVFEHRTSQIFDPPDGRLPPLTPEGQWKQAAAAQKRQQAPAGPEDRAPLERCISHGAARIGFLHARNNSYYQIVQTPGVVVILAEMIHEARVIPMDGRPHISSAIRSWTGDSRGHWEGSTLVIDTTNFSPDINFLGAGEHLHLTERLTRVDPDTIHYEVTVDDPATWTRPWKAMVPWKRSTKIIYEYACHEGNRAMEGILAGARAAEKSAAEAGKQ
jgi:hypothetical protein